MPGPEQILVVDSIATPIGDMLVAVDSLHKLRALCWSDYESRMRAQLALLYRRERIQLVRGSAPRSVREPLEEYLGGRLEAIDAIEVETAGTEFQRRVWHALRSIPAGTTSTYSALAERIGCVKAVRAVGLANGANPISVVVPCHRVIGSNGSLTGYGGGLHRKRWLLEHESSQREPS